jgi:hypothetical protein
MLILTPYGIVFHAMEVICLIFDFLLKSPLACFVVLGGLSPWNMRDQKREQGNLLLLAHMESKA